MERFKDLQQIHSRLRFRVHATEPHFETVTQVLNRLEVLISFQRDAINLHDHDGFSPILLTHTHALRESIAIIRLRVSPTTSPPFLEALAHFLPTMEQPPANPPTGPNSNL
jgi:hypothetical protein